MKKKLRTSRAIKFKLLIPGGGTVTIPKGTLYTKALHLGDMPKRGKGAIKYWVVPWEGMDERAKRQEKCYGFGLSDNDLQGKK